MEGPREEAEANSRPSHISVYGDYVHFREMKPSDLDEIMTVERASFSNPWSARFFLDELRVPNARSLLAEIEGRIVGYVIYWHLPREIDIHNLAVHPVHRRQGIARSLLCATINEAINKGSGRVTLEVRKSNQAAQRLYQSLGFVARGLRKGYYSDDGEDALVMVLELEI